MMLLRSFACDSDSDKEAAINAVPISLEVERFDQEFYGGTASKIPDLKARYPFLFPVQYKDSVWIARQKDSLQLLLQQEVNKTFADTAALEKTLTHLFQHITYYFPNLPIPRVVTLTNNVDYQLKTVYTDSLLLISLDTFLGSKNPLYEGIPLYVKKELDPVYLPGQIVDKFGSYYLPQPEDRTFLAQLIYYGKKLYLQDLLLPHLEDYLKIGYTPSELDWAVDNELFIWQYFVEKQLLYTTHPEFQQRFLDPAPFSKFYLEIDQESPGGIGRWVGWQIVKSFAAQNPERSIQHVLQTPALELFNQSKYKPKR